MNRAQTGEHQRWAEMAEELGGLGYWRMDATTKVMRWSKHMFRIFGFEAGVEPPLEAAMARVHPDDRDAADARLAAMLQGTAAPSLTRIVWPDGQVRHVEGRSACEYGAGGEVTTIFGTLVDVTEQYAAREALAASEAHLRLLTDHARDLILEFDVKRTILWLSASIRRYGYDPADLVGTDAEQLLHPDDVAKVRVIVAELFSGAPVDHERDRSYRIRTASGGYAWMEGNPTIIRDAAGKPTGVVTLLRDVTEHKAANEALADSEARYRLVTEASRDIVVKYAKDGTILFASQATRLFGYEPEELVGLNAFALIHPEDLDHARALMTDLFADPETYRDRNVSEYRVRMGDGAYVWVEGNPSLIHDEAGEPVAFTNCLRDITKRKAVEADLRAAQEVAEAAAAVKGDFLANMSHELRTPLTSVLGFTRLAHEQPDLTETSRGYISKASNAGAALLATVNDILDFSTLESGQLAIRPEPCDVATIGRETLELFGETAAAKGVELRFEASDLPNCLSLDPNRLRQLLLNMIGNAVKFSDSGEVTLAVGWTGGRLAVSVTDQGPGMSADQQALLFRRFSQVDGSSTRKHGGTGLGLAICMGLVQSMGGEIGVESEPGRGSRFFFEVPAPTATQLMPGPEADGDLFPPGTRVLVTDDHAVNRELVRAILTPLGAEVTEAKDGHEAVALAARAPFDLILMDLRMPGMGGLDAMRAIRDGAGPNQDVPILAFSAGVDELGEAARRTAGFDGDLAKPLMPADLIAAVSLHTSGWEAVHVVERDAG